MGNSRASERGTGSRCGLTHFFYSSVYCQSEGPEATHVRMKKNLLCLLGVILSLQIFAQDFTYTYQGQTLTYTVISEKNKTCMTKEAAFTSTSGNNVSGNLIIPAIAYNDDNGYTVTTIGFGSFNGCSGLTSVEIPNTVIDIEDYAFRNCTGLTSFTIPDSVTNIGSSAFRYCSGLTSIIIPSAVSSIDAYAFGGCTGLKSVLICGSGTTFKQWAFDDCTGIIKAAYPDNIANPFPSSCVTIPLPANYIMEGGVIYGPEKQSLIYAPLDLDAFTIPASVTAIGDNAFYGCAGIKIVKSLAEVPPTMADNSFEGLYDTATLLIPEEAYFDTNWSLFKNAFKYFSDESITYLLKPGKEEGADNLAIVFSDDYSGLTEVTIPYRINDPQKDGTYVRYIVDEISDNAFKNCSQLIAVGFHGRSAVKTIGTNAFAGTGITSVDLPAMVESIGDSAFLNTSALTEITLPPSLKKVGTDAFRGSDCSKVNISDIKAWCGIDFANKYANPLNSGTLYINGEKVTALTIPNLTTEVKKYAFYNAADITSVTLGNGVTSVGEEAFANCTGMTEVIMSPSTETIGASAFAGDTNLATIVMGHGVKTIGEKAFDGCAATTVSITAQTPPTASNNSFSHYTGKFYVQGEQASDAYFDAYVCWDRFDPQPLTEPTDMEIDRRSISGKPGDTFQLTATLQPADVSLPQIFWRSTNPDIASVDERGLVTIHQATGDVTPAAEGTEAAGTCRIIAESLYADGPVAEVEVDAKVTGIDNVTADGADDIDFGVPLQVYSLQGIMIAGGIDDLPAGIYIVRQGDKVKKIAVR